MDLDDILNRAEDHETLTQAAEIGASLGGEGFLQQFAAVSDIKNDMSWEDIIPLEDRQKIEEMDAAARQEEILNQTRKRATAVNYEGMDGEQPVASNSKPPKKATKPTAPRKTAAQRSMELKERDVRVLIRALQRWGDIRVRYDTIVSSFTSSIFTTLIAE